MLSARPFWSVRPFQEFFKTEAAGGALLIICTAAALLLANSAWAGAYHRLWTTSIAIGVGGHFLVLDAHHWINDGLMAVFFLLVGLEIKREVLAGELASVRQAALPIAGAIGGMIAPAAIYVLVAGGGEAARGWAIPMATDIAFALAALALVGARAPVGLKVFLAALAIVDDIGAVLVIAIFYTSQIDWHALQLAAVAGLMLIVLNLARVRSLVPYCAVGAVLWFFVHESGIHSTVAGVLLAFAIPARTRIDAQEFSARARELLDEFERGASGDRPVFTSKGRQQALFALESASHYALAPLLTLEHALHGLSAFVVMPLFAFANAGVSLSGLSVDRVAVGIILGLVLGKSLGITGAAFVAVRSRVAALPQGVNWPVLNGVAWFGGIGFTMALFIATLAFEGTPLLDSAKVGILTASAVAAIVGAFVVRAGLSSGVHRVGFDAESAAGRVV